MTWPPTPRVEGSDGHYQATLSRDWEIWGPNGGYIAAIALRAAGAHSRFDRPATLVGHFLGVADFDAPSTSTSTTLARGKARGVDSGLDDAARPADLRRDGVVGRRCLRARARRHRDAGGTRSRVAAVGGRPPRRRWASSRTSGSGRTSTNAPRDWIDDWENRAARRSRRRALVPLRAALDVRRPVGRRVPLGDPPRHAGLARGLPACTTRSEYIAPSIDLSCAFHRSRPEEPGSTRRRARRARAAGSSAARAGCGRATARCSPSAPASCSAARPALLGVAPVSYRRGSSQTHDVRSF